MFTITANTGYHILDVGVDGASVGAASGYTFTNVTANHTITAAFAISLYTLNVSKGGNGSGHVTSVPPGIGCGLTCAAAFDYGTIVTLTATPLMATVFAGWSGAVVTTTTPLVLTMDAARQVTATFNRYKISLRVICFDVQAD
jgi:hypothetical protein